MTSDANSGRAGLWTPPKFPGDIVRELPLRRGEELGYIAVQQWETCVRVGSFLPGPDPQKYMHYRFDNQADALFDNYVQDAYAAGWQNYHGEPNG